MVRAGDQNRVDIHVPTVRLSTSGSCARTVLVHSHLTQVENWKPPREIDGRLIGEASFVLPPDLEPGYHSLWPSSGDDAQTAS